MILIYKRPSLPDGYIGVMTAPHSSVTWVVAEPMTGSLLRMMARELGVRELELDAVLASADEQHFGGALRRREPATVETRQLTQPDVRLLLRCGEGYVGVVTGTPWRSRRRPRGELRCDWIFARPIAQKDVVSGMAARGHHAQDIWDLISATDKNGWGYV